MGQKYLENVFKCFVLNNIISRVFVIQPTLTKAAKDHGEQEEYMRQEDADTTLHSELVNSSTQSRLLGGNPDLRHSALSRVLLYLK